jgi:hypothetical protein
MLLIPRKYLKYMMIAAAWLQQNPPSPCSKIAASMLQQMAPNDAVDLAKRADAGERK